ncbi:DUF5133 domain-containing protein [Streptomyces himalayensis]|uniref:DUF5133 domain-containing protein n=1 Tax=Streptomyces himalayensis subsp. himalayensis TaxID=2756131 RepID=A0A7W0DIB9_9ACTN|nr:DUF5133 domain-containing protein [Streptomyces himalayensis]MBA2945646.1 DUF5133 domain-containing protein [Streptomyces himalayensis subsp. himalayensis]
MPLINYSVLRDLLDEFDTLTPLLSRESNARRRLEDVQYTVCVYTGLRDPQQAVSQARDLLSRAEVGRR